MRRAEGEQIKAEKFQELAKKVTLRKPEDQVELAVMEG